MRVTRAEFSLVVGGKGDVTAHSHASPLFSGFRGCAFFLDNFAISGHGLLFCGASCPSPAPNRCGVEFFGISHPRLERQLFLKASAHNLVPNNTTALLYSASG